MEIRRYTKADIPAMVTCLEIGLRRFHYGRVKYDSDKVTDTLVGNLRNPNFFAHVYVDDNGEIAGWLAAELLEYMFSREVYAQDLVTILNEGKHPLKAVTGLVAAYVRWGRLRGAKEIRWSQSTGHKIEKFAALAKRLGFSLIGTHWSMEING